MSDVAIRVENLSKQYKIRRGKRDYDTLRDRLTGGVKGLFRSHNKRSQNAGMIWALKDVSFEVMRGEGSSTEDRGQDSKFAVRNPKLLSTLNSRLSTLNLP